MERRNEDLSRKMDHAKKGADKVKSRSINENTELIAHCNELRKASHTCCTPFLAHTPGN